ncbi:MAG: RagB/SusD family nutrient uptake outer membrane protein, partial [Bacteroidota bacterium]
MKKHIYSLLALLVIAVSGCDYYDFDAPQPIDSVSAELAITDARSAAAARAGVYDELQDPTLVFDGWLASYLYFSDDCIWQGTFPTRAEFSNFNVLPANTTMTAVWNDYYDAINVANNVIEILPNVEDVTLTDDLRNTYIGEARFARALTYFHLVQGWGEVPLVTTPTREVNDVLFVPRNSVSEIFDQIIEDAEFARDNIGSATLGITPAAANALLARVYMILGNYPAAETAALAALPADYDATTDNFLEDEIFYLKFNAADGNSLA